jgi:hypothetical protein
MKISALFASFALPLAAIARSQVPLQDQSHLEFAEKILRNSNEEPQIPPGNFMSMLDSNKLCENVSTVILSVPGVGTLTFDDGKAYMRNSSDSLSLPVTWTIAGLKDYPEEFIIYHTDPFGKEYYLYDNGGHLEIITYSSSAGRYKVLYTNNLKRPSLVLSASERCMTVYRGDDQVYLTDNSPCTPIVFKKVDANIAGDEDDDLGEIKPIKWYDPASSEENPTCSGTLTKYSKSYTLSVYFSFRSSILRYPLMLT